MNPIFLILFYLIFFSIPAIIPIIIFSTKARNRKNYIERNGYSPEDFEEVKRFKELLDCGIITQEEFDEKKKQLLNL